MRKLTLHFLLFVALTFAVPSLAQISADFSGTNGGSIRPGYDSRSCDASVGGAIRYNSSSSPIEPSNYNHYWRLDELSGTSVSDSAGSLNGTWSGSASVASVSGQINTAFDFNGSTHHVEITDNPSIEVGANFSLSFWINFESAKFGFEQDIFNKYHNVSPFLSWQVIWDGEYINFGLGHSDLTYTFVGTGLIHFSDTWYHVAFVKNGDDFQAYINGNRNESYNQSPSGKSAIDSNGSLYIGSDQNQGADSFDGVLDDIRIYGSALSAAEVQNIYSSGLRSGLGCVEFCDGTQWVCP